MNDLGQEGTASSPMTGWIMLAAVAVLVGIYAYLKNGMPTGKRILLSVKDLEETREEILDNVREHCRQVYKETSPEYVACETAAAIATAEITDVFEKRYGLDFNK